MRTCSLCGKGMLLQALVEGTPLAQWACFCNSGNYERIELNDFYPEAFFVVENGDEFQSVFPSDLAEYSQLHSNRTDAVNWIDEVIGFRVEIIKIPEGSTAKLRLLDGQSEEIECGIVIQ